MIPPGWGEILTTADVARRIASAQRVCPGEWRRAVHADTRALWYLRGLAENAESPEDWADDLADLRDRIESKPLGPAILRSIGVILESGRLGDPLILRWDVPEIDRLLRVLETVADWPNELFEPPPGIPIGGPADPPTMFDISPTRG